MNRKVHTDNYLERIPVRNEDIGYAVDEKGIVTLEIVNKGVFKRITQLLLKKPKISYIHLDEIGSFVWPKLDGVMDITKLGELVEEEFGEKAHPLYERLAGYFAVLDSYGFIKWNKKD